MSLTNEKSFRESMMNQFAMMALVTSYGEANRNEI
jgi:hypothetical protein